MTESKNTFVNMINVDDASSMDIAHWWLEARQLDEGILNAEEKLEEWGETVKEQLEELEAKGKSAAKMEKMRREQEMTWKLRGWMPKWAQEAEYWLEECWYLCKNELGHQRQIYRQRKEALDMITLVKEERLLDAEERVHGQEYEGPELKEDAANWTHWEQARRKGQELVGEIKFKRHNGMLQTDEQLMAMGDKITELKAKRLICNAEANEARSMLLRWAGHTEQANIMYQKVNAEREEKLKAKYLREQSAPIEVDYYNMDIEDMIDAKRQIEYYEDKWDISHDNAVSMVLEREDW
jgi:hypothetical protein